MSFIIYIILGHGMNPCVIEQTLTRRRTGRRHGESRWERVGLNLALNLATMVSEPIYEVTDRPNLSYVYGLVGPTGIMDRPIQT